MELNAVTIGNMSIDSKPVEIDGRRDRYREVTGDSGAGGICNESRRWPNVDTFKGLSERTTEGEKIDNLGDLTVKVRTEQHGGGDISSLCLRCDKGNIGSSMEADPSYCQARAGVASVRKAVTGFQGRIPLHAKNEVFVLQTWEPDVTCRRRVSVGGEPLERTEHLFE